jgi:hypothetical protein
MAVAAAFLPLAALSVAWQGVRGSPEYRGALEAYRAAEPRCEWCGAARGVEVHHELPVRGWPDRAADTNNMVSLCRRCHFVVGHACGWRRAVTNVQELVRLRGVWEAQSAGSGPRRE